MEMGRKEYICKWRSCSQSSKCDKGETLWILHQISRYDSMGCFLFFYQQTKTPSVENYNFCFLERPHLSVGWSEPLPPIDPDQCVLLYRDVKLQEAWLLQPQLGTPEHPRGNVLTHPLPDVHLSDIKGVVLLVKDAGPS